MPKNNCTNKQDVEHHPLLPSGEWEGFYCYHHDPTQHKMLNELLFLASVVSGGGVDDVSNYTWSGKYELEKLKIEMTKHYSTHTVEYKGDIDENGIWGLWEINYDYSKLPPTLVESFKALFKNDITGGFHIWPKKGALNKSALEVQAESKKLKDIFLKEFS